ncbi:Protein S-Myc [Armadillidium nasatum]|uniref:Protein S-Myc n=1 Tax=Armadillidium nasatum TaxID=96803 RepID=A0A5N5SU88_9CRUS|nr:Protein S-Myc [Armadillidium nasatum]
MEFDNPFDSVSESSFLSDFNTRCYVDDTCIAVPNEPNHSSHDCKNFWGNPHYNLKNSLKFNQEWDINNEFLVNHFKLDSSSSKSKNDFISKIPVTFPSKVDFYSNENCDDSLCSSTEISWKNLQFLSNFNNLSSLSDNPLNIDNNYSKISHITPSSLSTLPTPPYSPHSSSSDPELDKIIKKYPEILNELPARSSPKFEIILDDIEKCSEDTIDGKMLEEGLPSSAVFYNENLEDCNLFPSLTINKSDYFPNTPCTNTIRPLPPADKILSTCDPLKIEKERLSVNFEHNYCLSGPEESYCHKFMHQSDFSSYENESQAKQIRKNSRKPLIVTQEKHFSSNWSNEKLFNKEAKSSFLPHVNTSSAQLKKQLQTFIKDKSKPFKGRVRRPPKIDHLTRNLDPTRNMGRKVNRAELTESVKKVAPANLYVSTSRKKRTAANDPDDDLERRANHNSMERCRRNSMKQQFQTLRSLVPQIYENPKASKALILKAALHYVQELQNNEDKQLSQITFYIRENSKLKKKIEAYRKGNNSKF